MRVFTLIFIHDVPCSHTLILILAACTMIAGVLEAGAVLLIFHVSVVKTALFLLSGVAEHLRGLYRSHPSMAALFLIASMGLAGLPPQLREDGDEFTCSPVLQRCENPG
jgi:multicomponent Na+:H+ antiporter subunit D